MGILLSDRPDQDVGSGGGFRLSPRILVALIIAGFSLWAYFGHTEYNPVTEKKQHLDLTADQQTQVKAIWEKEKPGIEPLMQQMHQNHEAMKALEAAGPYDEVKTRALATQNAQTMIELQVAHARIKSEMVQILTPDQKTKLTEFESKHEGHMGERMSPPPSD